MNAKAVEIGDWVALQHKGSVEMGYVANVNNGQCVIAIGTTGLEHERSDATIEVAIYRLNPLGLGRWELQGIQELPPRE